ncbi:hypothetical protein [Larkinella sp.]|uniref:hypothetical protein n=1 Tax=Larkinella sp. TaxID=2034517 RepID=UPI003BAD5749
MKQSRQVNQYDKIFRENLEAVIPNFVNQVLGITVVVAEEIPDDIQHTKERKPDLLKKITDDKGRTFILHLEFQVFDESEMVYRMAEYDIMLLRKYRLPVEQYVIYLGAGQPKMPVRFSGPKHQFEFSLIIFSTIDYRLFLKSNEAAEIVLGILGSFQGEPPEQALRNIANRIAEISHSDFSLKRYYAQLRILAQLRSLELELTKVMIRASDFFKEERDPLYMRGVEKEGLKKNIDFTKALLAENKFSIEDIARLVDVSVDFVKQMKKEMEQ